MTAPLSTNEHLEQAATNLSSSSHYTGDPTTHRGAEVVNPETSTHLTQQAIGHALIAIARELQRANDLTEVSMQMRQS